MARNYAALILATFAALPVAFSQENPPPKPEPSSPAPRRPGEFGNVRRALESLTPEQRQRFIENLKRWNNLPPEEKKALADRDGTRRKKIAEEIDRVIDETGLKLAGEKRAHFARRYFEERRKIEEQLRKEMEEKRGPMLNDLTARLKTEFSAEPPPAR